MEELPPMVKFWKWFVTFRNPKDTLKLHSSFLAVEMLLVLSFLLTLRHASRLGGRPFYLWLGALFQGLAVECLSYIVPDVNNFWHAQSTVMLLGQRLPMHIIFLYPIFIYTASFAVSRLNLKVWAEPFAVGLAVIALDFPWDVLGVKLLWWTWHDTDPNIEDRLYWVPWTSFYFFAAFNSSFILLLCGLRMLFCNKDDSKIPRFFKELSCSVVAGVMSVPCGILQFVIGYHVLHDVYGVSTSLCVIVFLAVYATVAWSGGNNAKRRLTKQTPRNPSQELMILVAIFYLFMILTVFFARPEQIQSLGFHEPIGDCNISNPVHTPIGMVLQKRKYLCIEDFDEKYYNFECIADPVETWPSKEWYTICGTPFEKPFEYFTLIVSSSLIGLYVYYQMLMKSEPDNPKTSKHHVQKLKVK